MTPRNETISVQGISFVASHGATEEERHGKRRFEVDVELETPWLRAAETDELSDTIDYGQICDLVVQAGTERTYRLLEALADAIVRQLAHAFPQARVHVEVRKLAPPIAGAPRHAAVRLSSEPGTLR